MIMQDQSKRLSEPLRWGRREKTAVASRARVRGCWSRVGLGAYAPHERLARARRTASK